MYGNKGSYIATQTTQLIFQNHGHMYVCHATSSVAETTGHRLVRISKTQSPYDNLLWAGRHDLGRFFPTFVAMWFCGKK